MKKQIFSLVTVILLRFSALAYPFPDTLVVSNLSQADSLAMIDFARYCIDPENKFEWPEITRQSFDFGQPSP